MILQDDHSQAVALAIAPKVGAAMSIMGSTWIFLDVMGDREKRTVVHHRLLFMLSFFDLIVSTGAFASTWPMIPSSNSQPWHARGNSLTCNLQGFAMQLGGTLFFYNAFLSLFYVSLIVWRVHEQKLRKYEICFHIVPILFGLTTAIIPVIQGWYHNANLWCWIAVDPACLNTNGSTSYDSDYCHRYDHIFAYRLVFFFGPLWVCFFTQLISMFVVFRAVWKQERIAARYTQPSREFSSPHIMRGAAAATAVGENNQDNNDRIEKQSNDDATNSPRRSSFTRVPFGRRYHEQQRGGNMASRMELPRTRQVATQAILYILAFYITYIFATINRIIQHVQGSSPFWVVLMHSLCLPWQGFWNFFIYRRPFYLYLRRSKHSRWQALRASFVLSWFQTATERNSLYGPSRMDSSRTFLWGGRKQSRREAIVQLTHYDPKDLEETMETGVDHNCTDTTPCTCTGSNDPPQTAPTSPEMRSGEGLGPSTLMMEPNDAQAPHKQQSPSDVTSKVEATHQCAVRAVSWCVSSDSDLQYDSSLVEETPARDDPRGG